ncbi:hypothetical protein QE152_g9035 [Popillia japonica]|uniref:Uncharacterized protein n=1 Tax=Popillia japonica TaxID=7064 RepID=A0AAW1M166_POPJA
MENQRMTKSRSHGQMMILKVLGSPEFRCLPNRSMGTLSSDYSLFETKKRFPKNGGPKNYQIPKSWPNDEIENTWTSRVSLSTEWFHENFVFRLESFLKPKKDSPKMENQRMTKSRSHGQMMKLKILGSPCFVVH